MQYGAMQWLLGKPETVFETAAQLGLDGVELGFGDRDLTTDPAVRAATAEQAAAAGIAVPSLCIGCLNRGGFSSDEAAVRDRAVELVDASIDAAAELGARTVLVPFFFAAHPKSDQELDRVVERFQAAAPKAEAAGITLGYEGELPAARMIEVLDRIDSPAVRCYYDVGNAVWLGFDPLDEIALLGERICQIHFKEFTEQLNDRPLGEGKVPVPEACDAIRAIGYDGWIVLETGTFGDPLGATGRQLAYLRQFI